MTTIRSGKPKPDDDDDDDDGEAPMSQRCCVDCAKLSPKTQTAHTLISAQHGWRLLRAPGPVGVVYEWRCPQCWATRKARSA